MANKKSNMDKILAELGERFINYDSYIYLKDEELLYNIVSKAEHTDLKQAGFSQKYNFTVTKDTKESTENILERAITLANNLKEKDSFYNQYPFNKGEHIDLLHNKTEIIELKQWDNTTDSPLFALIEILKYYCLLNHPKHREYRQPKDYLTQEEITAMTILAPQEYYEKFSCEKLKDLTQNLSVFLTKKRNGKPLSINFKSFNLSKDSFIKIKDSLEDKFGNKVKDLLEKHNKVETDWTLPFNQEQLKKIAPDLLCENWTNIL